jgi:CBS domain-containing protein
LILKEKGSLPPKLHAKEFMVKPVITIPKTTTLFEAETLMQKNKINRLPVVNSSSSKEVIGIINFETVHSNLLSSFAKSWVKSKF